MTETVYFNSFFSKQQLDLYQQTSPPRSEQMKISHARLNSHSNDTPIPTGNPHFELSDYQLDYL